MRERMASRNIINARLMDDDGQSSLTLNASGVELRAREYAAFFRAALISWLLASLAYGGLWLLAQEPEALNPWLAILALALGSKFVLLSAYGIVQLLIPIYRETRYWQRERRSGTSHEEPALPARRMQESDIIIWSLLCVHERRWTYEFLTQDYLIAGKRLPALSRNDADKIIERLEKAGLLSGRRQGVSGQLADVSIEEAFGVLLRTRA